MKRKTTSMDADPIDVEDGLMEPEDCNVQILATTRGTVVFRLYTDTEEHFVTEFFWKEAKKMGETFKAMAKKAGKLMQ